MTSNIAQNLANDRNWFSGRPNAYDKVEVNNSIKRIHDGVKHSHRNDGSTFQNRNNDLAIEDLGYYKEYVHSKMLFGRPGAQRIIIGGNYQKYWYTPDHYKSFYRLFNFPRGW